MSITVVTPTIRPNGLERLQKSLQNQTVKPLEWLVEINYTGETDFNQSMNKMIARAKGDWIVSVQDYIAIPDNALAYIESLDPAFYTFPVGKIREEGDEPKWDWRMSRKDKIHWQEWEICFGAAPRQWLIDIGGFDEELDKAWGFDNVNTGRRAHDAGYPMFCDNSIAAIAIDHDAFMKHPLKHKRDTALHNQRLGKPVKDIQKYVV